jgi:tuftelin-interacting protein 11
MSFVSGKAKKAAAPMEGDEGSGSSDDDGDGSGPEDGDRALEEYGDDDDTGGAGAGDGWGNRPSFGTGGLGAPPLAARDDGWGNRSGFGMEGGGRSGLGSKGKAKASAPAPVLVKKPTVPVVDPFAPPPLAAASNGSGGAGPAVATVRPKTAYGVKAGNRKQDKAFGGWEKNTKGFGAKMLEKMGWTAGSGLGVNGDGVVNPIQGAKINRGSKKLGLQDSGERSEQSKSDFGKQQSEAQKKEEAFREQLAQWKAPNAGASKPKKIKYKYATVAEIAARAAREAAGGSGGGSSRDEGPTGPPATSVPTSTMKVVDMTGAEPKVFNGYDKIVSGGAAAPEAAVGDGVGEAAAGSGGLRVVAGANGSVPMPELQNNINLLVTQAVGDITDISAKIKRERNRRGMLAREKETLTARVAKEGGHVATLKDILSVVADCRLGLQSKTNPLGLAGCADVFARLKRDHPLEYGLYGLASISGSIMFPMIRKEFATWSAITDPLGRMDFFRTCKTLLATEVDEAGSDGLGDEQTMFERMCWEIVMPRFRAGLLNDWNPRDYSVGIDLLEAWRPLLPEWVIENIQTQLVLPRLTSAVDAWDPRGDAVPVHAWLHPWLPVLGDSLNALYGPIRFKLAICLQGWHPSDGSAKGIIEPWKAVWSAEGLASFLQRSIEPKLAVLLRELVINPTQQEIAPFRWLMSWRSLMSVDAMGRLLDQLFFPKMLGVLCSWLSGPSPNFEEISRWYIGWKQELDGELASHPAVKKNLDQALDFMNKALMCTSVGGSQGRHRPPSQQQQRHQQHAPVQQRPATAAPAGLAPAESFKDLVEQIADKVGVVFMPKDSRTNDGKVMHSFGKLTIYIDQGVVFGRATKADPFLPMGLNELERRAT